MTAIENLSHDDIAAIGARWLLSQGYKFAFHNMTSQMTGEQPDVLGIRSWGESFLLEAKVSRADFLADKKKPWRSAAAALGDHRGYITPKGLLLPSEIPYGWWLLEVHGVNKPRVKVIKGRAHEMGVSNWSKQQGRTTKERLPVLRHCTGHEMTHFNGQGCRKSLLTWMCAIFSRAAKDGVDLQKYANGKLINKHYHAKRNQEKQHV